MGKSYAWQMKHLQKFHEQNFPELIGDFKGETL